MPSATNATILTLVPKKPRASAFIDYMPISCCKTVYKIILKLLVTRLKPILPELILQERLLVENTLLAAEIMNSNHKSIRITVKVDIA